MCVRWDIYTKSEGEKTSHNFVVLSEKHKTDFFFFLAGFKAEKIGVALPVKPYR